MTASPNIYSSIYIIKPFNTTYLNPDRNHRLWLWHTPWLCVCVCVCVCVHVCFIALLSVVYHVWFLWVNVWSLEVSDQWACSVVSVCWMFVHTCVCPFLSMCESESKGFRENIINYCSLFIFYCLRCLLTNETCFPEYLSNPLFVSESTYSFAHTCIMATDYAIWFSIQ